MLVFNLIARLRIQVPCILLIIVIFAGPTTRSEADNLKNPKPSLIDVCHKTNIGGYTLLSLPESAAKKHFEKHSADVSPTNELCISQSAAICPFSNRLRNRKWHHEPDGLDDEGRCMADLYNHSSPGKTKFHQSLEILLTNESQALAILSKNNNASSADIKVISVAEAVSCARLVNCVNFLATDN